MKRKVIAWFGGVLLLAGCHSASTNPNEPTNTNPNLKMVAEGTNKTLSFKATHPGELYAYDMDSGEYVYRGHLSPGEQFVLEADSDHASIDKQPVSLLRQTNAHDNYRLYFLEQ
jgi:hypothetical protein